MLPDSLQPWPLQAFWPLQALLALLHALWPLQALVPAHFTPSAAKAAEAKVVAAKIDAAVAIMVRLVKMSLLVCEGLRSHPHPFGRGRSGITGISPIFLLSGAVTGRRPGL